MQRRTPNILKRYGNPRFPMPMTLFARFTEDCINGTLIIRTDFPEITEPGMES